MQRIMTSLVKNAAGLANDSVATVQMLTREWFAILKPVTRFRIPALWTVRIVGIWSYPDINNVSGLDGRGRCGP